MSNILQTQRKCLVPRVALSELVYSKEKDEFIPKNLTKQKMSNQSAKKEVRLHKGSSINCLTYPAEVFFDVGVAGLVIRKKVGNPKQNLGPGQDAVQFASRA